MRKAQNPASVSQEPSDLREDEDDRLSAADWERCIKDDCASWELPCLVYINDRCHEDVFPRPTLIQVEYFGSKESYDPENWEGLVETIEHDFALAGYESRIGCANPSDSARSWKQWVIVPRQAGRSNRLSR